MSRRVQERGDEQAREGVKGGGRDERKKLIGSRENWESV